MAVLIFKETEACNSNCIYCDVISRKKPRTINMERLEKVFVYINEYLEANPDEDFSIVWHGGEPCIVGAEFYRNVKRFQDKHCAATQDRIHHDIQTNLTLINQELIDVFMELGINMAGTSYEPYKGIRGFGPQRDSSAYNIKFYKGIDLIEKNGWSWGFIYVITRNVLDKPEEVFRLLTNFRAQGGFQLHPVYSYKNEDPNGVGITAKEYADFLGEVFKIWWPERNRFPYVSPFRNYLQSYTSKFGGNCSESGKCAYSHIYIGPDGTYSHCGRASDWDVFDVGDIDNMSIIEAFRHPYRKELAERDNYLKENDCRGCQYFSICHGGCPLDAWNSKNTVMAKSEWCLSTKYFLKHYFEPISGLSL